MDPTQTQPKWSTAMDEKQDQKSKLITMGIKLALSLAFMFPVYILLYLTYPASLVAFWVVSAVVFALFAPWDELKKKFLS